MLRKFLIVLVLLLALPVRAQEEPHPLLDFNLAHPINLTETMDGITVTLDWAYADTQGFTIHTTVENMPPEIEQALYDTIIVVYKLRDLEGNEFSFQGGGITPVDSSAETLAGIITYYTQAVRQDAETGDWQIENDYFHAQYPSLPEAFDLQFELTFADPNTLYGPAPDASGQIPPSPVPAFEPVGPFVFDFTVPLPTPVELEPNQSVELNDLTMTLETLEVTPAHADARLCIELPDPADWQPQGSIAVNGVEGLWSGSGVTDKAQFANSERRCFNLRFDVPHEGPTRDVVVSLDAIEKSMAEGPDDWLRIQGALAVQGIDMTVISQGHGVSADIPELPDDMTMMDAINMAREQLGDRIVGPWVFTITVS